MNSSSFHVQTEFIE